MANDAVDSASGERSPVPYIQAPARPFKIARISIPADARDVGVYDFRFNTKLCARHFSDGRGFSTAQQQSIASVKAAADKELIRTGDQIDARTRKILARISNSNLFRGSLDILRRDIG